MALLRQRLNGTKSDLFHYKTLQLTISTTVKMHPNVRTENPFKSGTIADSLVIKENEHSKRSLDRLRLNKQFLFVFLLK